MYSQLEKAIKLAKKTGDRLMIFDPRQSEAVFVVMSLDEYEKMVIGRSEVRNLTEDELLDKINRDIAVWKSEQDLNNKERPNRDLSPFSPAVKSIRSEPVELTDDSDIKANIGKNHWRIPKERKMAAEEIIEEDRQYLEDI